MADSLFSELKRRNVIRVGIAYLIVAWAVAQVADLVLDSIEAPSWVMKVILLGLAIGFFAALVISWAYELTPEGIKKEKDIERNESITNITAKKLDIITLIALAGLAGLLVWQKIYPVSDNATTNNFEASNVDSPITRSTSDDQSLQNTPVNKPNNPSTEQSRVPDKRSIAVLPFLNLSSDKEQEYFSDGLADTILHQLAQIPELQVAARTSSFKFKGQNEDMREIARTLGVATLLEGSVQRQGNRVRITVQLIQGSDGSHLWSRVFDDTLDDIFRVQDEIAAGVANAMKNTWKSDPGLTTEIGGTKNLAAYEAYLKGTDAARRGTPQAATEAVAQLELAVDLDPDYALAWAALSSAYEGPASLGTATWESTYEPMKRAAEKAVALAPNLPAAYLALANTLGGDEISEKLLLIEKAVSLAPNDSVALAAYGRINSEQGKVREALSLIEKAVFLNPLDTNFQSLLASSLLDAGLVERSLKLSAKLVKENPTDLNLQLAYAWLLREAGQQVNSARVYKQILKQDPNFLPGLFATMFMRLDYGDTELADQYLRRIETLSPNRALDDRAEHCLKSGNRECHEQYALRYLALLRTTGEYVEAEINAYEGVLWIYRKQPENAIKLLKPHTDYVTLRSQNTMAFTLEPALYLALAFGQTNNTIQRDKLLDEIELKISNSLANGLWPRFAGPKLVRTAAVRGDANLAAERLAVAMDNGYAPVWSELQHYVIYDSVRDEPAFKKQMQRVKADAIATRKKLSEKSLW